MNAAQLGQTTAEMMEYLEQVYEDDETAEVREVLVIACVNTKIDAETGEELKDESGESDGWSRVHYRCSTPTWHHQLGLIEAAKRIHPDR